MESDKIITEGYSKATCDVHLDGQSRLSKMKEFMQIQSKQHLISSNPMKVHCENCNGKVTSSIRYVETPFSRFLLQLIKTFARLSILGFGYSFAVLLISSSMLWLDNNYLNVLPFHISQLIYFRLIPYSLWGFIIFSGLLIITIAFFPNGAKNLHSDLEVMKNVEHQCPKCKQLLGVYRCLWDPFVGNWHFQLAPTLHWLSFGLLQTKHEVETKHNLHADDLNLNAELKIPVTFDGKMEDFKTTNEVKFGGTVNAQVDHNPSKCNIL